MFEYINLVLAQWPFFAASAVLYGINNGVKKAFPSPDERKAHAIAWSLLPLYPILLGSLFGALSGSPLPESIKSFGKLAGPLYYSCSGLVAIYARDLFVTYTKYMKPDLYGRFRQIDPHWGEESIPPPNNEEIKAVVEEKPHP